MKTHIVRKSVMGVTVAGALALAGVGLFPITAVAGEVAGKNVAVSMPTEEELWNVDLWSDGWIMQLNVQLFDDANAFEDSFFLGFDTIMNNLNWIVPIGMDIRRGRFGFMPDVVAAELSGASAFQGRRGTNRTLSAEMTMAAVNLIGYYRLIDEPRYSIDVMAGARHLYVDLDLALTGPLIGTLNTGSTSRIWDGVVGARYTRQMGDKIFFWVSGDVGAGDSEFTWQVWANAGYQFTEHLSISVGYRYIDWEERSGTERVDLSASGPIILMKYTF